MRGTSCKSLHVKSQTFEEVLQCILNYKSTNSKLYETVSKMNEEKVESLWEKDDLKNDPDFNQACFKKGPTLNFLMKDNNNDDNDTWKYNDKIYENILKQKINDSGLQFKEYSLHNLIHVGEINYTFEEHINSELLFRITQKSTKGLKVQYKFEGGGVIEVEKKINKVNFTNLWSSLLKTQDSKTPVKCIKTNCPDYNYYYYEQNKSGNLYVTDVGLKCGIPFPKQRSNKDEIFNFLVLRNLYDFKSINYGLCALKQYIECNNKKDFLAFEMQPSKLHIACILMHILKMFPVKCIKTCINTCIIDKPIITKDTYKQITIKDHYLKVNNIECPLKEIELENTEHLKLARALSNLHTFNKLRFKEEELQSTFLSVPKDTIIDYQLAKYANFEEIKEPYDSQKQKAKEINWDPSTASNVKISSPHTIPKFQEKFYSVKKDSIVVQCEEHDTSQWSSTTTFGFRNKIYRNVLNKIDMNCLKDDCNPDDSNDVQCCFPDKFKTEVLQYSNHIIFSNTHSDSEKTFFYVSNKTFDSPLSLFCLRTYI